jgi:hypothetical protein
LYRILAVEKLIVRRNFTGISTLSGEGCQLFFGEEPLWVTHCWVLALFGIIWFVIWGFIEEKEKKRKHHEINEVSSVEGKLRLVMKRRAIRIFIRLEVLPGKRKGGKVGKVINGINLEVESHLRSFYCLLVTFLCLKAVLEIYLFG